MLTYGFLNKKMKDNSDKSLWKIELLISSFIKLLLAVKRERYKSSNLNSISSFTYKTLEVLYKIQTMDFGVVLER